VNGHDAPPTAAGATYYAAGATTRPTPTAVPPLPVAVGRALTHAAGTGPVARPCPGRHPLGRGDYLRIARLGAEPNQQICGTSSRISGWRATDSISLPKMRPVPTPIEPSLDAERST
jgi:hypothetical protein